MSKDFIWGSDTNLKRIIKEIAWDTEHSKREDKESYLNERTGSWGACKQLAHGLPTDHSSRSSSPPATAWATFTAPVTAFKESLRETDDFPTLAFNRDSMSGRMKRMKSPCCSQLSSTPCCLAAVSPQVSPLVALGSSHGDEPTSGHPMLRMWVPAEGGSCWRSCWVPEVVLLVATLLWPPCSVLLILSFSSQCCVFPENRSLSTYPFGVMVSKDQANELFYCWLNLKHENCCFWSKRNN